MPPVFSKIKHKKLSGQSRELVANVLQFMEKEAVQRGFTIPVRKAQLRTVAATGVSERMVRVIKQEMSAIERGETSSFSTPDKTRKRTKTVTNVDDFDQCVIRRTVHEFYTLEKCAPTVRKLKAKLEENIGYKGSYTSLRKILKQLGFKWAKTKDKNLLVEKSDIRSKRIDYLTKLKHFREQGHPIVFTDESYILSYILTSEVKDKAVVDDADKGLMVPQRLIIVHAGSADGFVPNAEMMWQASAGRGDEHDIPTGNNYTKWVKENLIPNLRANSVVVVGNALYHNVDEDKSPTSYSKKEDMVRWLTENKVAFVPDMLKPQLYELIRAHRARKKFLLDELLERRGHHVLRLPPHHPDLNPIELIWAQLRNWVAERNTTFKMDDIIRLCRQQFERIGKEDWTIMCNHVEKIEREYLDIEAVIDDELERIVKSTAADESGSESDSSEEEEDDDDEDVWC